MNQPGFVIPFWSPRSKCSSRSTTALKRPRAPPARSSPCMSGVNGGIDYTIDLTNIPLPLRERITYVQQGPDSPTALIEAAEQIAASSSEYPETLPVLVDMLGYNNPVAANIAVKALVEGGDASIPPLLAGVSAFNYSVNAYALRALGRIGRESVKDVCLACARKGPIPNVRRAACRALASLQYSDGKEAYQCLVDLLRNEADWGVRYAAVVALQNFEVESSVSNVVLEDGLAAVKDAAGVGSDDGDDDATVRARAVVAYDHMSSRALLSAAIQ